MKRKPKLLILFIIFTIVGIIISAKTVTVYDSRFVSCIVDPHKQNLKLYWKDEEQQNFRSLHNLKIWLEKRNLKLEFAMNAGMYKKDNSPQGLYIEKQKAISPLDTANGNGNFYLKPNGVFYLTTKNISVICTTEKFKDSRDIRYATQSGPMLVINGEIHSAFKKNSTNLNIRNGVGILPNNKIIFAMSKEEINFYDFAEYFKNIGCENALYLDGFVSRTYFPKENWIQSDGDFGVIIGITNQK